MKKRRGGKNKGSEGKEGEVDLGKILGMPLEPEEADVTIVGVEGEEDDEGEDKDYADLGEDPDLEAAVSEISMIIAEEVFDNNNEKAEILVDNIRDLINILLPS